MQPGTPGSRRGGEQGLQGPQTGRLFLNGVPVAGESCAWGGLFFLTIRYAAFTIFSPPCFEWGLWRGANPALLRRSTLTTEDRFRIFRVYVVGSLMWAKLLRAHGGCLGAKSR